MTQLLNSLAQLNEVRFSAYRTGLKIRAMQKRFNRELRPHLSTQFHSYAASNSLLITSHELIVS